MKILAIDTSTKFLCLGIYDQGKIYEYNLEVGTRLSALLAVTIKRVLDALGWQVKEIDYFACGLGPGSFTGLRVGLAAIKGLAWPENKPIIGISTLDILARNASLSEGTIIPVIDAKRGLIYCGIYQAKAKNLKRISPYLLISKEDFFKKASKNCVILGDALNLYKEEIFRNIEGANILEKDYWYPQARNIIYPALQIIKEKKCSNAFAIQPIYLYPKECQIKNQ